MPCGPHHLLRLRYPCLGNGPDVILIPGLASSGAVWDGAVHQLKDHYRCHVLTLAGFAGTPRIENPFLQTVRDQLADYIRDQHLIHPVIVGHSLGGFMALWLASSRPDLVGPLVIVDALPFLPAVINPAATAESSAGMAVQLRDATAAGGDAYEKRADAGIKEMVTSPANYELVRGWSRASDPVAVGSALFDMFTHDLRPDVARIAVPTLVLGTWIAYRQNEQDTATRAQVEKNFETQYSAVKDHKIVMADHARHFIMLDDPTWFYAQLKLFLAASVPR